MSNRRLLSVVLLLMLTTMLSSCGSDAERNRDVIKLYTLNIYKSLLLYVQMDGSKGSSEERSLVQNMAAESMLLNLYYFSGSKGVDVSDLPFQTKQAMCFIRRNFSIVRHLRSPEFVKKVDVFLNENRELYEDYLKDIRYPSKHNYCAIFYGETNWDPSKYK